MIASPRRTPCLCFDRCAMALETRPLLAVLCAHPPAMSNECPAASNGGGAWGARRFPGRSSWGRSAIALPRSHSPCTPRPFCDVPGMPPPTMSIDRSKGSRHCTSFYGCELWCLLDDEVQGLCTAWRKSIRKILELPYLTHCYLLPLLCRSFPIFD